MGNYTQYVVITYNGEESKKNIYICIMNHLAVHLKLPVHPKGNQFWVFTGRTDAETKALAT